MAPPTQERCVNAQGFSLHAEVRLAIHQRHKLESQTQGCCLLGAPRTQHLCRYIARPALANERLALNRAGQVVLRLKTPYRDGTTRIVMESQGQGVALLGALRTEPLEFMQRLAALVPRPRLHLIHSMACLRPMPNCVPRLSRAPPPMRTHPPRIRPSHPIHPL